MMETALRINTMVVDSPACHSCVLAFGWCHCPSFLSSYFLTIRTRISAHVFWIIILLFDSIDTSLDSKLMKLIQFDEIDKISIKRNETTLN